jgi:hypothetical protein
MNHPAMNIWSNGKERSNIYIKASSAIMAAVCPKTIANEIGPYFLSEN